MNSLQDSAVRRILKLPAKLAQAIPERLDRSPEVILAATSRIVSDALRREKLHEERRREPRWTVHHPIRVTPIIEGEAPDTTGRKGTITAFIRDISTQGVGLLHAQPFSTSHVLARFELIGGESISVVVRLKWTASLGDFGHASGGIIVAVLDPQKVLAAGGPDPAGTPDRS